MNQDLKKTLWAAADKLRASMDAAEYKHIVLGLIFLKYISDAFCERRAQLSAAFADESDDLFLPDATDHVVALEERDYYTMANVFWVPAVARWETLRAQAKQADIGVRIDAALEAIEADNARLKGILDKRFGRTQLEPGKLGELVDLISKIGFGEGHHAKDLLGEVYEYFLGQFATAEGKKGGQFYTPASVVRVLVEVLAPHQGRVYDPCCGSGGMFVQSEKFIESHGGRADDISIYGQEANPTTWRLVAMNLAIRGFAADLGKEPADTFHRDQHPDLRADYVLANPPFNISDWGGERLADDRRWAHGTPPAGNANYAWLQHILHHLSPHGQAGVVLANGSMTSNQNSEGDIRRAMVEADVIDVMVALPPQLFLNTQIPACLWFLTKDKSGAPIAGAKPGRDRRGEVLFIDARKLGRMESRVVRVFDEEHISKIAGTVHRWRADGEDGTDEPYADVPGFCRSVKLAEIAEHGHLLTPGRYVGAEATEDDDEVFDEKMERLTSQLFEQMAKGAELDAVIREKLGRLSYAI
ncbi:type I restriction-modification system subunit M [Burkholderia vietnamiensis]|uniref:site-specific DNA-methyltransferase (adenine-specific) n=1 Tax=Burkholderia vietnamiensis (strain G4 / LMG 22486) TaxID=269482 RepID=A4J9T3_BURVG|nr:class I SAM-dependent DNA methyltransferase [Burkholderia vietnamiensis]ABO53036.1 N-6 DNA methylase [Burkholderia vietnamiensis G4]KVR99530.1 restriction endonuclease subunit M [Burkholderia vietnamiensis]MBR8035293.1 SAM-dependent DNA methyltransferase [Burkholderia vietnamiensis]MCB4346079.1 type I restriction-modification system subunit M [Burkholderia vietnamiensis]MDN7667746.1 class I SAM-dependent DNA methyltransferase [Burkholderia vietnamiensis]